MASIRTCGVDWPGPGYYEQVARAAAQQAGVDPNLFFCLIRQESGFDPNALSPAGAVGIAQIVPQYHPGVNPCDPVAALQYAARLIRQYLDQFGGEALALAAYNAGAGAVQQYGGVPPYAETQRYVQAIQACAGRPLSGAASSATGSAMGSAASGDGGLFIFALIILAVWFAFR